MDVCIVCLPSIHHVTLIDKVEKGQLLVLFIQERNRELEMLNHFFTFHPINGRGAEKNKIGLPD